MELKTITTDGDYVINLNNVKSAFCILKTVTYVKKPSIRDYETDKHNVISNIKTFYIKNYFLVTAKPEGWDTTEHDITKYLCKVGAFKKGSANFRELYRIPNHYSTLQNFDKGLFPKDLFSPIKQFINNSLFHDDDKIKDFYVKSDINIKAK